MGQCASIAPSAGVPRCRICGLEAIAPWSQLEHQERAQWVRQRKGMACRKCLIAKRLDRIKYEKARAEYARVKDELYPKASAGAEPLRRVRSGQAWEGTHSFSASWRPSSSLRRLMSAIEKAQQAEPGKHIGVQRKPTGYIPPHAAAALAPTSCAEGLLEAAAALDASGPAGLEAQQLQSEESLVMAGRARLAALEAEEGIERVEEVSVEETSSPEMSTQRPQIQRAQSFHCSPATGGQHEAAAGGHATEAPKAQQAVREPEPQQGLPSDDLKPPALLCEASGLSASGCHGDSAYLGEEEPSQWVCSRA